MAEQQPRPILITGAGRRIGLALAHHFLQQRQPVIVSYRTPYPAIDGLREAGALCLQADFSSDDGILTFAEAVKSHTDGLRAIIHNASDWMAEKPGVPLSTVGLAVWSADFGGEARVAQLVQQLQLSYAIGSLLLSTMPGMIADRTGSYAPAYLVLLACSVVSILAVQRTYLARAKS